MKKTINKETWDFPEEEISVYSDVSDLTEEVLEFLKNEENISWVSVNSNSEDDDESNCIGYILNKELILKTRRLMATYLTEQKDYCREYGKSYSKMTDAVYLRMLENSNRKNYEEGLCNPNTKISVLMFLNDDYEGGELYFPNNNLTIKPKKNQLIIFPTMSRNYEILDITSGSQYVFLKFLE